MVRTLRQDCERGKGKGAKWGCPMSKQDIKTSDTSSRTVPLKSLRQMQHAGWTDWGEHNGRQARIRGIARMRQEQAPIPKQRDVGPVVPPMDLTTPGMSPAERGVTVAYLRAWQERQCAGRDFSYPAFWLAHGLCPNCYGRGQVNSGRQEHPACTQCGGTGLAPSILRDESGQDLVEYALIIAAIALALVATLSQLSGGIASLYQSIVGRLTGVEWQDLI